MGKDVIVACDFSSAEQTFAFLDKFTGRKPFVKIGMELYYAEGPEIVRQIKARGHKIFLDLKLHDIPNTVKKSMAVLRNLDVDITNLHAAGTTAMMKAALEGLTREDGTRPLLIAVTQLTSTDQEAMERDLLIHEPIDEVVMHYAETAKNAGLDGVVCSPLEAQKVHDRCGKNFLTITPGVRFADGDIGDQKRVMTPAAAKAIGSDYIVVGRPITAAADPVAAYERCVAEFVDEDPLDLDQVTGGVLGVHRNRDPIVIRMDRKKNPTHWQMPDGTVFHYRCPHCGKLLHEGMLGRLYCDPCDEGWFPVNASAYKYFGMYPGC